VGRDTLDYEFYTRAKLKQASPTKAGLTTIEPEPSVNCSSSPKAIDQAQVGCLKF